MAITTVAFAGQPCPDPSTVSSLSDFPRETPCDLGVLPGGRLSTATGVSADGSVIVGQSSGDDGLRAVRWVDGKGPENLGALPGGGLSAAYGVSADGSVIVGRSDSDDGLHAVRWVDGKGPENLGVLPGGGLSAATGVSADGGVIVGQRSDSDDRLHAVRWVDGKGPENLGILPGGKLSAAYGVNADGSVIVGRSDSDDGFHAVRWVDGKGPENLGVLPGGELSAAYGVSADGSVIVGQSSGDDGLRAVRWVDGKGPENLGVLPGGSISTATGVSGDGSVIVGQSGGGGIEPERAFIWRTVMQDLANLLASFPQLAGDSDVTRGHFERQAALAADQTCLAESGGHCIRTALTAEHTGSEDDTGERSGLSGLFSFGRGLGRNNGTTFGATLGASGGSMNGNAFDMNTGPALALWAEHSEFGLSRVGWQASGSIGWTGASGKVTRGGGLSGVIPETGKTDMDTRIVRASLGYGFGARPGYGFRHSSGWLLTPRVGIAHYLTHRDGYAETNAEFDVTYDRDTTRRTLLTLAVSAKTGIGDLGDLVLSGGVGHDLSRDDSVLSGASDIPGMERFAMKSALDRNDTRPFVSASYNRPVGPGGTLSATVGISTPEFGDTPQLGMGVNYTVRF